MASMRLCTLVVFMALAVLLGAPAVVGMNTPPVVNASGTYFQVGFTVGQQMKSLIAQRMARSQLVWKYLLSSPEALLLNSSMFNSTANTFPELLQELQGMASGSGLSFAQIFFLNTMTEIESLQQELTGETGLTLGHCTDVYSSGTRAAETVWGHNEDSGPHDCNVTYIVNATIVAAGKVVERFIAYTYPASVAGRAFGWNHHGLIITTNALFANNCNFDNPRAIPRAIHNRAMYRSQTVREAIDFATSIPSISAFALNVGTWDIPAVMSRYDIPTQFHNVEVNPIGAFSIIPIYPRPAALNWAPASVSTTKYHFYHANNYDVLQGNATIDVCSSARLNRLNEFPIPTSSSDVRDMLGDVKNSSWPVWQHGCDSGLFTMATAIFEMAKGEIHLYANNPKTSTAPTMVLPRLWHP